jgi:hypothetical protein
MPMTDDRDRERLALLDRIAERCPEIKLDEHSISWGETPDGAQALHVGETGEFFANAGDDLHAYGTLAPIIPGAIGCIEIEPSGARRIIRVEPDPLAKAE